MAGITTLLDWQTAAAIDFICHGDYCMADCFAHAMSQKWLAQNHNT